MFPDLEEKIKSDLRNWSKYALEDESNELLDESLDMEEDSSPPYAMIFFQRLSKLQEASDSLRIKGYYNVCEDYYDAGSLYERRKSIYRRLKNGNEKS